MNGYERESRESLGTTNLACEARQNFRQLLALVHSCTGYALASVAFTTVANSSTADTLFNRIESGEYPEYQEFKEPLKLVLAYLLERKYNDQTLVQIANKFPGTYFHDVVHNL